MSTEQAGHYSESGAEKEASDHMWDDHDLAVCADIDGVPAMPHDDRKVTMATGHPRRKDVMRP
ncbi:MAG: hypothetical protein LC750_07590 [Actinobacteria bacterium]|nr:hypothetical protein [Actinomycetota bacterium]